jgi:anaerobic magnesium-protoporphyrin IX monomethyl ester cyclase
VNPKIVELMKAIDGLQWKLGVSFALRGFVKAELFTAEQAKYMREAGFRWLLCGFESGSPRILKNINKRATQDDNKRMLDTAHDAGINVKALMSIGHPGESLETLLETHDWLMINQPDDFDLTIITVYPGTPYYDEATQVEGTNVWRFTTNGDNLYHQDIDFTKEQAFYKGMPGEYKSFVWTDYLTSEELVKERDWMESELRERLHIPYPQAPAINYERTMGQ